MFTTESPVYIVALVNTAAWFFFHMMGAWLATKLPLHRFDTGGWFYRSRRWERNGMTYENVLKVRRWKKFLPDGAAMFRGGFPKKHILPGKKSSYYSEFMQETCRAELTHWVVMLAAPLFFIWNSWTIAIYMIPYAVASNAPCIIAQRYNRPRIRHYASVLEEGGK